MMQIEAVGSDGGVNFQDGSKILADIILHCTGWVISPIETSLFAYG